MNQQYKNRKKINWVPNIDSLYAEVVKICWCCWNMKLKDVLPAVFTCLSLSLCLISIRPQCCSISTTWLKLGSPCHHWVTTASSSATIVTRCRSTCPEASWCLCPLTIRFSSTSPRSVWRELFWIPMWSIFKVKTAKTGWEVMMWYVCVCVCMSGSRSLWWRSTALLLRCGSWVPVTCVSWLETVSSWAGFHTR